MKEITITNNYIMLRDLKTVFFKSSVLVEVSLFKNLLNQHIAWEDEMLSVICFRLVSEI